MRLQFTLAPLAFVPTFASTILASMVLIGDLISNFTLEVQKAFVLHALHHLHQTLNDAFPLVPLGKFRELHLTFGTPSGAT